MSDVPLSSPLIMLNPRSPVPLHVQLQEGIRKEIERDTFKSGDRLPTVQEFARSHELSTGTVMRAFTELIRQGVLEARRGAGTFVSKRRAACTEVLLPDWCSRDEASPELLLYSNQLMEGLRSGMGDPTRRFSLSSMHGSLPTVWETLQVCAARGADSLFVHNIEPNFYESVRSLARNINTVVLMGNSAIRDVDMVCVDGSVSVRSFLERRIKSGQRQFAYMGYDELISPLFIGYNLMFEAFKDTMKDAGITPTIYMAPTGPRARYDQDLMQASRQLAAGTTIFATTPSIAAVISSAGGQHDLFSYTENKGTMERYRDKMSLLYMGIDEAAREAAHLLVQRIRNGPTSPAQVVKLKPRIVERSESRTSAPKG